jgi:hypothetical protein
MHFILSDLKGYGNTLTRALEIIFEVQRKKE